MEDVRSMSDAKLMLEIYKLQQTDPGGAREKQIMEEFEYRSVILLEGY